jgi:hypothetical protein
MQNSFWRHIGNHRRRPWRADLASALEHRARAVLCGGGANRRQILATRQVSDRPAI